jgi:hypothetical protein
VEIASERGGESRAESRHFFFFFFGGNEVEKEIVNIAHELGVGRENRSVKRVGGGIAGTHEGASPVGTFWSRMEINVAFNQRSQDLN